MRGMKLAEENLMKIAHSMLLFFFLNMVSCELRCLCGGIRIALTEPDAKFHFRGGREAMLLCAADFPSPAL